MFDIGWTELLLIAAAAIIVVGPKDLPGLLRSIGQMVRKVRNISGEFKHQLNEALEADEIRKLKEDMDDIKVDNPMTEIKDSLESQIDTDFSSYLEDDSGSKRKKTDYDYDDDDDDDDDRIEAPKPVKVSTEKEASSHPVVNGAAEQRKTQGV